MKCFIINLFAIPKKKSFRVSCEFRLPYNKYVLFVSFRVSCAVSF
jgi:hypothetical protein